MSRRTLEPRERLVLVGVLTALAGLAIWPAFVQRSAVRQVEFAWEMYAKMAPTQSFTMITSSGATEVALLDVVVAGVAEIPYEQVVPEWLCRRNSQALVIMVHFGGSDWEYVCDP